MCPKRALPLLVLMLLSFAYAAPEGTDLRIQANQLLMKAEKSALFVSDFEMASYHVHVTFTLSRLVTGDEKGEYTKDFLSPEQWRERVEMPGFREIHVRNKQSIGEKMNLDFEPVRIYQLRMGIPPRVFRLDSSDVITRIARSQVVDTVSHCVEFKTIIGKEVQSNQLCIDDAAGALSRWRHDYVDVEWSNFTSFRGKVYPRHFIISERGSKIVEADVEYSDALALTSSMFEYPPDYHKEAVCQKFSAPVRIGGEDPVFPSFIRKSISRGTLLVAIKVGVDGHVEAAQVVDTAAELDAVALEAVKHWRFEPAKCDGNPREQRAFVLVTFKKALSVW